MTNFCDDSGLIPVTVKVKGVPTEVNVDFYDAFEYMLPRVQVPKEGERIPFTVFRDMAVEYFNGDPSDWTTPPAKKFWDLVSAAVKDAGKDESALDTQS
jgi:hypothetical protein